jgi:hypothetical protein
MVNGLLVIHASKGLRVIPAWWHENGVVVQSPTATARIWIFDPNYDVDDCLKVQAAEIRSFGKLVAIQG